MQRHVLRETSQRGGLSGLHPSAAYPERARAETPGDRQNFREVRQNFLNPHGEKARGACPMSPPPSGDSLIVLEIQAIPIRAEHLRVLSRYVFGMDYASLFGMDYGSMIDRDMRYLNRGCSREAV